MANADSDTLLGSMGKFPILLDRTDGDELVASFLLGFMRAHKEGKDMDPWLNAAQNVRLLDQCHDDTNSRTGTHGPADPRWPRGVGFAAGRRFRFDRGKGGAAGPGNLRGCVPRHSDHRHHFSMA